MSPATGSRAGTAWVARFTGEWFINYALIALGGGVLVGITVGVFEAIDLDVTTLIEEWILPSASWAPSSLRRGWWRRVPSSPVGWRQCWRGYSRRCSH